MTTAVCSQILRPSSLPTKRLSELCQDHVKGQCGKGDLCNLDHGIYHVERTKPPSANAATNYLTLDPRPKAKSFDNESASGLSTDGPRHSNDLLRIQHLKILPPTDEVLSLRDPCVPFKDPNNPEAKHWLARGFNRYVDTLFRHLRTDNVEALRDVCYDAAQQLVRNPYPPSSLNPVRETGNSAQYGLFWDVEFENILSDHKKGLIVRASFLCPSSLRGINIHKSSHFEKGMMAALIGLDSDGVSLSVTFFEVHLRESTDSMKQHRVTDKPRAAVQLSFAQIDDMEDVRRMIYYSQKELTGRFVLVDFPRTLLAGFAWCLKALQQLKASDCSFHQYYAPQGDRVPELQPPEYAKNPGFQYDLSKITKDSSTLRCSVDEVTADPGQFKDLLKQRTTFDEGQADSFAHALKSNLAFTQGPPGCGKTYLGVALTKTLISSIPPENSKPILAVCMTNHALDSFLGDLVKDGITDIARVGKSKDESMNQYSFLSLLSQTSRTDAERSARGRAHWGVENLVRELERRALGLSGDRSNIGWQYIGSHLRNNYPHICTQFKGMRGEGLDIADFDMKAGGFAYDFWSAGGDLDNLSELHAEFSRYLNIPTDAEGVPLYVLEQKLQDFAGLKLNKEALIGEANIWQLPLVKRQRLIQKWTNEVDHVRVYDELAEIHIRLHEAIHHRSLIDQDIEVRCLAGKKVIGMTTTACAKNFNLLQKIGVKICICEEAGEVIEPHTLCTMLSSLQHGIFIGDPLQLRPKVNDMRLSLEVSNAYRLNESLFERFYKNKTIATSTLDTQRRSHPDLAEIARQTLYPHLKNAPSTELHPPVADVATRMYWFDHREPETSPGSQSANSKSFSNAFEVQMATALVRYLIQTNAYKLGDIAVLTPYNGQLSSLVQNLHGECEIFLTEKDRISLVDNGLISEEHEFSTSKANVDVQNMLRLRTTDEFQGEEAKVVILLLTRSNTRGSTGFLNVNNRINVACTRARHGFFIIGNSRLFSKVPMWAKIINIFNSRGRLGSRLPLCCPRHPGHHLEITKPEDFNSVKKCNVICGQTLPCGDPCPEICHAEGLHELIECPKTISVKLECGHDGTMTCKEQRTGQIPRCKEILSSEIELPCKHLARIRCDSNMDKYECKEPCNKPLPCEHLCPGNCSKCKDGCDRNCSAPCGKLLPCGHNCNKACHSGPCGECTQQCQESCPHGKCKNVCSVICDPCVKKCLRENCTVMCCLPCNVPASSSDEVAGETTSPFDLPAFTKTVDRMTGKIARKLGGFAGMINAQTRQLRQDADEFLSSLRCNPLAAKENARLCKARLGRLDRAQQQVLNLKEQVIVPFMRDMQTLESFEPVGAHAAINLQFGLRFNLLVFRARLAVLEDAWMISQRLSSLKGDPSLQTSELAKAYKQIAIKDSEELVEKIKTDIDECVDKVLPCLEIELHILHLNFLSLAQRAKGAANTVLPQDLLCRAADLCSTYPDTAGKFQPMLDLVRKGLELGRKPGIPGVNETRELEKKFSSYEYGKLVKCDSNHPYSAKTFHGCPECGRKVDKAPQSMDVNYEEHLQEEEFLIQMALLDKVPACTYGSPRATSHSPPRSVKAGSEASRRTASASPPRPSRAAGTWQRR